MLTRRFFASDRIPLCADVYEPEAGAEAAVGPKGGSSAERDPPRGQAPVVCIVHGYCEHRGRYRATATALAREGFRVVVPDLRGHGESGGQRAHVLRFRDYLDDLSIALRTCVTDDGGAGGGRPFLIGHSMGGLVATLYALERPGALRALVLSSPFFGLKVPVPAWKQALGRLASRIYPALALPNEIDPAHLSHDASVGQAYAADPLVSRVATARWFTEALAAQAEVRRRARTLQLPVLLLHAGDDRIADPGASQRVFDRIGGGDKVLTLYPGLFHEIFNELERERVLQDLVGWLKAH